MDEKQEPSPPRRRERAPFVVRAMTVVGAIAFAVILGLALAEFLRVLS
jgi:hypothetical protein